MRSTILVLATLVLGLALVGCGSESGPTSAPPDDGPQDATPPTAAPDEPAAGPPSPRDAIQHQLDLLVKEDVAALKACFTERLRDRITEESVAAGAKEVGSMTLDDLYASDEPGEHQGHETVKVKMKNGRTLTTLILIDGTWLADTIWFR